MVDIRNEALRVLGKTGRTGLQIDIFRRKTIKNSKICRLNNTLLNNQQITE